MPIIPGLCAACGGGGASGAVDVEDLVLCDINPATGEVVGSAIAVYTYDDTGAPTGPPTFVIPGTNDPYVVQFMLQPCDSEGQSAVVELCDVQADQSSVQFVRHYIFGPTGLVASFHDSLEDGSIYVPTGTVQECDPYALCTPDSNIDLNADCGPGQSPVQAIIAAAPGAPLANSVFVDDATADPLCGGTWNRPASALPVGFPVEESFRNTTFDDPGPVVQGSPTPFLTAGPPVNDGNGAGWFREADTSGGSNGLWQVPTAFSTSQGINAAISWASHDGTIPGGDGQAFVFTDGSVAPQAAPIGGFGNLGLQNWQGGVFAIVLDEYGQTCTCDQTPGGSPNPGPCGFCSNTISIQRAGPSRIGATCSCCTIASASLNPKALNQTTRAQPVRLLTSVVTEAGQTYVSASLDWNDGNGPIQYFDRVNVTACVTVPATLRMAAYSGSGGAFQAIKEIRDAVARPAGVSNWRAFPIVTDPIVCPGLGTVSLVNIDASVDVTPNDDGSQTSGNGNPELYFWLVNTATNTIVDSDQISIIPSQLGNLQTMTVSASVPPGDVPNLRLYVGAESRDDTGEYDSTWENLTVSATAAGCPATPRRTMEISARCAIPVTIVGGSTDDGGGGGTTVVNTPSTFEDAAICATVAGVQVSAFRREIHLADGTIDVSFLGTSGLPITPTAWTAGPCATPVFAGFVCDVFGGTPVIPATPPTCPGGALGAGNVTVGTGMTEGPAGTYTQSANVGASLNLTRTPNDDQHAICSVRMVFDASTGDNPFWQAIGSFIDSGGNPQSLIDPWISAVEANGGFADLTDLPPGTTGTASIAGTAVTITFDGPSGSGQMFAGNGAFFVRQNDADGQAAGVTLDFNPPIRSFQLGLNNTAGDPGTVSGLQQANATPGTAAIPAQPASFTTVKQFRNADGTSFYENLDGTTHVVAGTIGDCGEFSQELLCDQPGGTQFLRLYKLAAGTIESFQDYDLTGAPYAVTGTAGLCEFNVTTRDNEQEVLCWTETSTGNVTQFLRRYLYSQDGITLDTVIDTLLDGTTPFNASNLGTVAVCGADEDCRQVVLGTICYLPPPAGIPAQTLTDTWAGSTITGPAGTGAHTWTNTNFGGAGITVIGTSSVSSTALANSIQNFPPTSLFTLDLGAPRNNIVLEIQDLDINESLTAISPAATSVTAPGVLSAGNTQLNSTINNGFPFLSFPNGTQFISFTTNVPAGFQVAQRQITFDTIASTAALTQGTAAVVRDCQTGAISYVDLTTGDVLDMDTVTVVDCGTGGGCGEVIGTGCYDDGGNVLHYVAIRDCTTGDVVYYDTVTGADVSAGIVFATCIQVDFFEELLCDSGNANHQFLRTYRTTENGLIDAAGQFTDYELTGAPYAGFVGPAVQCPATVTTAQFDVEQQILCDATPTRFLRRYVYDSETPGVGITIVNTTLDGTTPFVPVGAVGVCTATVTTDIDFDQIELCDNNGGFLRRFTFNSTTGAVITVTNLTLAGAAYVPVGTVAICDGCCPVVVGQGCISTGSGKYVAIRNSAGVVSLFDAVTGAAALAANVIVCPSDDVVKTLTAQARQLTNATPWTPGADVVGTLTSLSVTGTSGLWDMVDQNGTVLTGLPAGLTLTWSALDDNTLSGPTSVTPQLGSSVVANWTQR